MEDGQIGSPRTIQKNKFDRLSACSAHVIRHKNVSFLDRIVTCDEKWVLYNNRKRSARWLNNDEAPKHMPKSQIHQRKVLLTVWWGAHGIIMYTGGNNF